SCDEIVRAVKKLKRNKSGGLEQINSEFFIETIDLLLPYLTTIFHQIYDNGIYPSSWHDCLLVPVPKKGNLHIPDNYRGISIWVQGK
ncbi:hypothetical protein LOTGIDRAFT_144346, partial [Lottia gigantea]